MTLIPPQLNNQRFNLTHDKKAFEQKWGTICNYSIDDNILKTHLEQEPTYGVICGLNNLIVIDFDNEEAQNILLPLLPLTFTVKTATKGLQHLYYFTDDVTGKRYLEPAEKGKRGKTILDLQGTGTYVIGPNAKLSNGKSYQLIHDQPIATIYRKDLLQILDKLPIPYITTDDEGKKLQKATNRDMDLFKSPEVIKIKESLKIHDLLAKVNIPIHKNPTECPFHESESKKCLSFNDELWHCFHCGKGGDVITLYQQLYNLDFRQSIDQLFKELFIDDQKYEDALNTIAITIRSRKSPNINHDDIDMIAKILIKQYNFITLEETDKVYFYSEAQGIYKANGEYIIGAELELYFRGLVKTHVVNEIINKIKRLTHRPLLVFDQHKDLICVKNGVFNLQTKLLMPHNPNYYFLNYIPISYNKLATCEKIKKFCGEIVFVADYELLLEIFGFVLCKDYDIQKAIMLVGGGANGKSVFLYVLKAMIGNDNVSAESLQALTTDAFAASQLFGKVVNISADINSATIAETGPLKDLTSGTDTISAQFKFQNKFRFINYAKLIFSCNTVPQSKDITNGYMRRWKIIKFPNTFEGVSDNKNLKYELTTEDELAGLFNLAVSKYFQLKKNGCFSRDETVDEIRENYINLSDPLQVFIDDYLVQDSISTILKTDLYDVYNDFCKAHDIPKQSTIMLTKSFKQKNIRFKAVRVKVGDVFTTREAIQGYCWKSVAGDDVVRFD